MDGIDTVLILDERTTVKYWKKVILNIIPRMILNSYTLYKKSNKRMPNQKQDCNFRNWLAVNGQH